MKFPHKLFTAQWLYNLVSAKAEWCSAAGKVTIGLASHWPCVTDLSGLSTYRVIGLCQGDEQGYQKPQRGLEKAFSWGASGEKMFEFCFLKWHILVYFIFLSDGRDPRTSQGPKRTAPFPPFLSGLEMSTPPTLLIGHGWFCLIFKLTLLPIFLKLYIFLC